MRTHTAPHPQINFNSAVSQIYRKANYLKNISLKLTQRATLEKVKWAPRRREVNRFIELYSVVKNKVFKKIKRVKLSYQKRRGDNA